MKKEDWIWMPHPAHFICASKCGFRLATYVGGFIVSTVGEYFPAYVVRKTMAEMNGHTESYGLKGDNFDSWYFKKYGYETIGIDRLYETMVFKSKESNRDCGCQFMIDSGNNVDFDGYNDAQSAYQGHMVMCEKWSKEQ